MRLQHGEHNENLSDHLSSYDHGQYNDWVITTAFYACIHFVEHKIFPCNVKGISYADFDEYCDYEQNKLYNKATKHSLKTQLVKLRIPGILSQYRFLKDVCMNARYYDYKVSDHKAKTCNDIMKIIKRNCV